MRARAEWETERASRMEKRKAAAVKKMNSANSAKREAYYLFIMQ